MRVIKGIVLFCFSMVAVSACFDPPEFSNVPKIFFKSIKFKEVGTVADRDSLILTIDFEDGDGDLGFSPTNPRDTEFPYNSEFYYLQNGLGDTIPIIAKLIENAEGIYTILNDYSVLTNQALPGKIVTNKTRTLPNYGYLPVYDPDNCYHYKSVSSVTNGVLFKGVLAPLSSVDASYEIVDTLTVNGKQYVHFTDPLLYRSNPYHYNIEVKFFQFQGGSFVEYDWYKDQCSNFNGRFLLSPYDNRPIEGTLRYGMTSNAFLSVFGNSLLKISVRIRDRSLHTSNTVYSQEFDLNEVRVGN